MKKRVLSILAAAIAATTLSTSSASAQSANEWVVGPRFNIYANWSGLAGVGAYARYGLTDNIRLEPAVVFLCRKGTAIDISTDVHYVFSLSSDFEIFPLAGVSFNKAYYASLGVNLGAGVSYNITDRISVNTGLKYMLETSRKASNPVIFSFGAGYRF